MLSHMRRFLTLLASAIWLGAQLAPTRARALDPFEIQVYDATANAPGVPGLELHVNHVFGVPRSVPPPLAAANGQSHFTLEPSIGVTPFWELGAYLQSALLADGSFDFAGVKFRSKFVTPPDWQPHVRLGVNLELSLLPRRFDESGLGAELRPIVAWENESWLFAADPIIEFALRAPGLRAGPGFAPALMGLYKWQAKLAFGLEYYAELGPIARGLSRWSAQEHYLFEVINLMAIPAFELNFGVGEGLTASSSAFVLKLILGYVWETRPAPPSAADPPVSARLPVPP
jgi:hypothetical protein